MRFKCACAINNELVKFSIPARAHETQYLLQSFFLTRLLFNNNNVPHNHARSLPDLKLGNVSNYEQVLIIHSRIVPTAECRPLEVCAIHHGIIPSRMLQQSAQSVGVSLHLSPPRPTVYRPIPFELHDTRSNFLDFMVYEEINNLLLTQKKTVHTKNSNMDKG